MSKINLNNFKSPGVFIKEADINVWTEEDERKRQYLERLEIYLRRASIAKKILEEYDTIRTRDENKNV